MRRTMQVLLAASVLCLASAAAAQQTPPPSQAEPAKPKAKKVWTNEDMGSVRKPEDEYADQKAAEADKAKQELAKAAADQKGPAKPAEKKPKDYLPKTAEEAQQRLAAKQYEIGQQYDAVDLVKKEQEQATSPEARAGFQKRIDILSATLEESIAELHAIDARLQELKANPPVPSQAAAAAAAASPAPAVTDLEKQIAEKQGKIEFQTDQIAQLREAVARADSDTSRASLQKKLDGFVALLEKTNAELKTLEDRLKEVKANPQVAKPESPKP